MIIPIVYQFNLKNIISALKINKDEKDVIKFFKKNKDKNKDYYFFNNASTALYFLLVNLKKKFNKEKVLVPVYVCPDILRVINKAGCKAVGLRMKNKGLNIDLQDLGNKLTDDVLCIIVINFLGYRTNISQAKEIAEKKNIIIIEDNAQAISLPNTYYLSDGVADAVIFSFGISKPVSGWSGGLLVVKNKRINNFLIDKYCKYNDNKALFKYFFKILTFTFLIKFFPSICVFLIKKGFTQYSEIENKKMNKFCLDLLYLNLLEYLKNYEVLKEKYKLYEKNNLPALKPSASNETVFCYALYVKTEKLKQNIENLLIRNNIYPIRIKYIRIGPIDSENIYENIVILPVSKNLSVQRQEKLIKALKKSGV